MKTINQIGKAALSRIFKPGKKGATEFCGNYEFERTVKFFQDNGNLEIPRYFSEETETGLITLSADFKVWSIELGLHDVVVDENETNLYKAIYKDYLKKPTHIIVINKRKYDDYYDHYTIENEDVCIYRVDMAHTECFDDSYEQALIEQQESELPFLETGNTSWL